MKKLLISLLLISLITMAGVFAEGGDDPTPAAPTPQTATLTLQTSIGAITQIGITKSENAGYGSENDEVVADLFGEETDYSGEGDTVAYVHFKTNDSVGMKVTMSGSTLKHKTLANTISYTLASYLGSTQVGSITPAFADDTLSGNTFEIFTKAADIGLVTQTQRLNLVIVGNSDDYPAGAYEATITFTLEAQ